MKDSNECLAEEYLESCYYARRQSDSEDWCTLSDNPCFKATGKCDTWNELMMVCQFLYIERLAK